MRSDDRAINNIMHAAVRPVAHKNNVTADPGENVLYIIVKFEL